MSKQNLETNIELIGYWNMDTNKPEIYFDIPKDYENYQIVSIKIKPMQISLDKNTFNKKLDRGLRKLEQTMRRLKYGK